MDSPTVALVTGASRGLGRAIALRLAGDSCDVIVNSMHSATEGKQVVKEIEAIGARAVYLAADVTAADEVAEMVRAGRAALGPITVLVNNAGWMVPKAFEDNDEPYWNRVLDTKIKGSIYTILGVLDDMKTRGWGKIVNITGDAGRVGLSQGVVHSGAQGALMSMTKSWAREFAAYGIRVNAVSPGPIETDQEQTFKAVAPELHARELWGPFGVGSPDDIAAAVAFFVRPEGDHITGQILSVNGGRAYPS